MEEYGWATLLMLTLYRVGGVESVYFLWSRNVQVDLFKQTKKIHCPLDRFE